MKKSSLKTKLGIALVILGMICPIFGLIIPFLGFDPATTTTLVAFSMVLGPEILLILGGILAGKEGVMLVVNKVKRIFGLPEGRYPATRSQYNVGLGLLLLWFITALVTVYIPGFFEFPWIKENLLWLSIGADVIFLIAIFGFGGHQMTSKIAKLFTWEPWELPPEKEKS